MNNREKIKKYSLLLLFLLFLGIVSFCFLAVFSYTTSPFTACDNGSDSAFFRLVGQGMTKGYLPYRDFFDMKGPFLFLIEYVGQLLSYGRLGIFIIQWVNLFASLALICFIFSWSNIKNRFLQCILLIPIAYVACFTFDGGNLTEEFSLLPLLSCLALSLIFFDKREAPGEFWQRRFYWYAAGWFGFCFGLLLMIRITNAALICAIVLTVMIYLISAGKYRQLGECAGTFLLGLTVSVTPAVLFFSSKGLLNELIKDMFVLGFKYSGEKSIFTHFAEMILNNRNQRVLLVVVPVVIPLLLKWKGWPEKLMAFLGAVFTFFSIASGNNYTHYYTLTIPLLVICEIALVNSLQCKAGIRIVLPTLLFLAMLVSQFSIVKDYRDWVYPRIFLQDTINIAQPIRDISSKIPEEDYDSVFCYNINPDWYTYTDPIIFPCNKYCGWQNHYISLIPEIHSELEESFHSHSPTWLVLSKNGWKLPSFLLNALKNDYEQVYENESYILYHYTARQQI